MLLPPPLSRPRSRSLALMHRIPLAPPSRVAPPPTPPSPPRAQENYERYKTISRPQNEGYLKGNFAIKAVGMQQGLSVSQNEIDDEVMTLQAQALQRKEKFKESEVRPKVAAQLERDVSDRRSIPPHPPLRHHHQDMLAPQTPRWARMLHTPCSDGSAIGRLTAR